jgi:hypothetical protein
VRKGTSVALEHLMQNVGRGLLIPMEQIADMNSELHSAQDFRPASALRR